VEDKIKYGRMKAGQRPEARKRPESRGPEVQRSRGGRWAAIINTVTVLIHPHHCVSFLQKRQKSNHK
jgi:hypothetical protein